MPFPPAVKERALIACGRFCCLCHKYCGNKIECNHIVPEADGGADTLKNCIPLCFDCHAEVGAYNPAHPKGNKFGPGELRAHRDNWIKKVKATPAVVSSPDTIEVDRKVFDKIRALLPSNQSIAFVRTNNFAGFSFTMAFIDPIAEFEHWAELPDSEFLDSDLEGLRSALHEAAKTFTLLIVTETYTVGTGGSYSVPADWEHEQPARFQRAVAQIHDAAAALCAAYDGLVKTARRKLNVA